MLFFGHVGITLGATAAAHMLLRQRRSRGSSLDADNRDIDRYGEGDKPKSSVRGIRWIVALGKFMDIRLLLVGSMLPDIIDKPVGHLFFVGTFSNGRIFSHSLFFFAILVFFGAFCYFRNGFTGFVALATGVAVHLFLDQMWLMPRTFLWPLMGFSFDKLDLSHWTSSMLRSLYTDPEIFISETVGAVILLWFLAVLFIRRSFVRFVLRGRL